MTPQEQDFINRALAVELPPEKAVELIIRGSIENWSDKQLRVQQNRAKFLYYLESLLKPLEEELQMLRDGEDCEC